MNTGFGLLLTFYLGSMVINSKMTLGTFVALSIYLIQLAGILRSLGGIYQGVFSQFVYVDRFFEVYEVPSKMVPATSIPTPVSPKAGNNALEIRHLSFSYGPGTPLIQNLDLTVRRGETTAIIGPSGTGKSTLAALIIGLIEPEYGDIYVFGHERNRLNDRALRKWIAIVLQDTPLLNGSPGENLRFAKSNASDEAFFKAIKVSEIEPFISTRSAGFDTEIGENGANLSQGQQQRLAIAMALIREPDILILDEATNQLDQLMEKRIIENIRKFYPSITMVLISCRENTLAVADTVYELKNGMLSEISGDYKEEASSPKLKLIRNSHGPVL